LPRHPEVKGSIPEASVGTEKVEKEPLSDMAITGSTVVEHSSHHPKVEGLSSAAAVSTSKEIQILCPVATTQW
jgi:hypothetical protein